MEVPQVNGHTQTEPPPQTVNVISGLLDLALAPSSIYAFDVRLSACECLKAYFCGHGPIKMHFLNRAIEGHVSEREEADNIISILVENSDSGRGSDPYRHWIAAVILFYLLYEDFDTKVLAMKVSEGNAENGEEVVTCIQALSANLIAGEQKGEDERISIGYLMVLCSWLYEDHDAVNDFLGEGSNVQSIVQLITRNDPSRILVSGLCALLLGIVYEFSTKDSPIPRATLHQILTTRLGREQYVDKITKLREHTMVRDYEVLHQGSDARLPGALPEVYFDRTFIDFLKDNFSRAMRVIDRAPGIEVPVVANGVQKGISRELVDSLKAQLESSTQHIQKLESDILTLERKLGQEQADHRKAKESATVELGRIKNINDALQRNHEEDMRRQGQDHERTRAETRRTHDAAMQSLQSDMQKSRMDTDTAAERVRTRNEAEIADLNATLTRLRASLEKSSKEHALDLANAHEEYSQKTHALEARLKRAEDKANDAEVKATKLARDAEVKEEARKIAQTELDDMLIVMSDLEQKSNDYKKRLKEKGEETSDVEDDEGEVEDEEENEERAADVD